jgi:hypothetical protein
MDLVEDAGVTAPVAYTAAFASVALSIGIWLLRRGEDRANAERFGIFVGLWAPTLMTLGKVLEDRERK